MPIPARSSLVGLKTSGILYSSTSPANKRVFAMGEIAFAVIPYFPKSFAVVRVTPIIPSEAAAKFYLATSPNPESEVRLTIRPLFCCLNKIAAYFVVVNTDLELVFPTLSKS